MKRKVLLSILAATFVALPTLHCAAQAKAAAETAEPVYKYEAALGYGYTALNQVNNSRYGLQGIDAELGRNFGKYFQVMAEGGYYRYTFNTGGSTSTGNPGDPTVVSVLAGPQFHAALYGPVSGFVKVLLGAEHTGGESMTPDVSFAGGYGGGMDYRIRKRFAIRLSGEKVLASFSVRNNSSNLGYSSHRSSNARVAMGVVYHF